MPQVIKISDAGVSVAVARAAEALRQGRLVIMPTDTVYGVAAAAGNPSALELIFDAKRRERDKPIPVLAAGVGDIEKCGAVLGPEERRLAEIFWPGPLTLVLKVRKSGWAEQEGFRVPDDETALALIRAAGGALRVTSANSSGDPPALTAGDAETALGEFVDVVLDAGPSAGGVPSTVARVAGGQVEILRGGAISREQLESAVSGRENRTG